MITLNFEAKTTILVIVFFVIDINYFKHKTLEILHLSYYETLQEKFNLL